MNYKFKNYHKWLNFDKNHLWHPYTSMINPLSCYPIESAKNIYIHLSDGTKLIDGMSSWWAAIHGYNHPKLNEALIKQIKKISHIMFGGIAHQPAAELGQKLLNIVPDIFQYIFFADSGSISIEIALKMALQYWQSSKKFKKQFFLTVKGGYHGDSFSCMSISDPLNSKHYLFPKAIPIHFFAPKPKSKFHEKWDINETIKIQKIIKNNYKKIAAIIIEPIVQGAGGMNFYHFEYLNQLRCLCDKYNILLIFDEIATGFGRTGKLFAMNHCNITPDIFCIGKALTGGTMTLAAVITTKKIAMTISNGDNAILMHGPTFMANPMACAVACANLDILMENGKNSTYPKGWQHSVTQIENGLQQLKEIINHPSVKDVRVLGAIGVIEMKKFINLAEIQPEFIAEGVWVRPFRNLIYIMPQFIINKKQLNTLCKAIIKIILKIY